MIEVKYKITSISPILFHNVFTMDLIRPKNISHAKWEKTEEVFKSRLYFESDKLVLPPRMITALIKNAAQKSGIKQDGKRGTYASLIRAVTFCLTPAYLDQKYEDVTQQNEYVTVNKSKIARIFPTLKKWSATIELTVDEQQLPIEVLDALLEYGGRFVGFGDYRPQYGRFESKRIED